MGIWLILVMIPGYAEVLVRPQADTASVYFLGRGKYKLGEVSFTLVVISLITSALFIALFLWQQDRLYDSVLRQVVDFKPYVYLILASIPVRFLVLNYNYLLVSQEDIKGYNIVVTLSRLLPSLLAASLLISTDIGVLGLIISSLVGGAAATAFGAFRIHKLDPMIPHRNIRIWIDLLTFGFKLYVLTGLGYIQLYVSSLIVVLHFSTQDVAFFRLSQERALILIRVSNAVSTLLYPRLSRSAGRVEESLLLTTTSFRRTLLVLIGFGAVGAILAKPGILLLYGSAFDPMLIPLLIFIPAMVAEASSSLFNQHFMGMNRLTPVILVNIAALGLQIAFLWFALARFGIVGVAIAVFAASLITMAMRISMFSRLESVPLRDLLVFQKNDFVFLTRLASAQLGSLRGLIPRHSDRSSKRGANSSSSQSSDDDRGEDVS